MLTIEIENKKLLFSTINGYLFDFPYKKLKCISFNPLDHILQITL